MKPKFTTEQVMNDIEQNRNHSWVQEILTRHKNEMDREVLDYFGNEITYADLDRESDKLAKAMIANGITKGTEFVVFSDRIPEYVYLIWAANKVGAKINICSEKFEEEYLNTIINNADGKIIFAQGNKLEKLSKVLDNHKDHKVITFSHKRSLTNNYYDSLLEKFYKDDDDIQRDYITDIDEFIKTGEKVENYVPDKGSLEDEFIVSYSSGTTKKGRSKAITHINKHYITMGRYHDPEVSGVPSLKNLKTYSNVPSYSNTYILSSLSDNMIMGGKVILDPIDDPDYFIIGMKIHGGNMNVATPSTWIKTAMNYYVSNDQYNIKELPEAMFNFAGGEPLTAGEEKFLNKWLKDLKAGTALTHTAFSLARMCTAGADCEHGSIFYRLLRSFFNKAPYRIGKTDPIGMQVYDFVDVQVLREDGTYCKPNEHGRVVVNSACSMKEYNHDPEETKNFYITDAYGKVWGNMNLWGYLDEKHNITMKGRYSAEDRIPLYRIADQILLDSKHIMSCEVVKVMENDEEVYVAHIVPQYGVSFNSELVLNGAIQRCINVFGSDIQNKLYFNIRSNYPLADSNKRDIKALKEEGLANSNCIRLNNVKVRKRTA